MFPVDLSIIIVNWNTRDFLAKCLQSVAAEISTYPRAVIETFVVDNGSTDHSTSMVQERFPWVHLIENKENMGFAPANNQAIREARGRYILLLNSDTEACAGAFEKLVTFMDAHLQAAAAGPRLLNADGSLQPSVHPMLTPWREFWRLMFLDRVIHRATYSSKMWHAQTPQSVETIKGACLALRQVALDQVGLLDESYFMYTEEVDLCYRLAQAGWQLWWLPAATIIHYGEASSRQAAQAMYLQLYRSKIQFYRKFGGKARADCFKRLVRVAYWPRWGVASLLAPLWPSLVAPAGTYHRLLTELPGM